MIKEWENSIARILRTDLSLLGNGMKKHKARAPLVSPLLHHNQNRTLLGPDDIPDFDIQETMEEWEDLLLEQSSIR